MVEHLLIGDLAALLLVLGLTKAILRPILAIPPFDRLQVLTHPLVAFPLWALNFYLWHVPALYGAAYGAAPVHALEHTTFLFFGCLMWMPVFGPLPKPEWFTAGWKVGVDGSVAIVTLGAGGAIDTENLTSPVLGFILDPAGLMYNLTLEGSKISRITR